MSCAQVRNGEWRGDPTNIERDQHIMTEYSTTTGQYKFEQAERAWGVAPASSRGHHGSSRDRDRTALT
jgi:hypothetical protein